MRGYGLSVFKGTTPERFEVEVLGVLENQKPEGSYILARLSGQNLEKSGVIAGMSGSPVYFDGRLAGAVAFSWPFATEPIAGITPIAAMRAIGSGAAAGLDRRRRRRRRSASPARLDRVAADSGRAARRGARALRARGLERGTVGAALGRLRLRGELARPAVAPAALLGPLAGGARRRTERGDRLRSRARELGRGGLRGRRPAARGDRHGHRSHRRAALRLRPLRGRDQRDQHAARHFRGRHRHAERAVVVQARQLGSGGGQLRARPHLRLGRPGRRRGAHRAARRPRARSGRAPRSIFELAGMPQFLPALAAIGSLGAWDVASGTGGVRSVDLALRVDLGGEPRRPAIVLDQSFDGPARPSESGRVPDGGARLPHPERARAARRERDRRRRPAAGGAARRDARPSCAPSRTRVAPGEALDLQIDARSWRGESVRWSERVVVPSGLPDGRYSLLVGDGASADAARLALAPAPPARIEQALDLLRSLRSRERPGRARGGLRRRALLRRASCCRDSPARCGRSGVRWARRAPRSCAVRSCRMRRFRRDRPLSGLLRVDIEIRRPPDRESPGARQGGGR